MLANMVLWKNYKNLVFSRQKDVKGGSLRDQLGKAAVPRRTWPHVCTALSPLPGPSCSAQPVCAPALGGPAPGGMGWKPVEKTREWEPAGLDPRDVRPLTYWRSKSQPEPWCLSCKMSGWGKNVPEVPDSDIVVIKRGDSYHWPKCFFSEHQLTYFSLPPFLVGVSSHFMKEAADFLESPESEHWS